MNKFEKEVTQAQLDAEKKTLRELKQVYKKAQEDVEQKIHDIGARQDLEHVQQILYQSQFQASIKRQIDETLDTLDCQYDTIHEFLQDSYIDGYAGNMFILQKQTGCTLCTPIDQAKVIRALQTDSKLSSKYYEEDPLKGRLAEDLDKLKLSVRAELSRGVLTGATWEEIAFRVAKGMNNPITKAMNDAMRIARTEGHRVNQEGFLDAGHEAKKKGADIVKQWDATLDSKTRPWHMEADGQIREWDDKFIVGGEQMDAPSVGGSARNVCNCRCQLLQRARWALDEAELKTLQDRASFFGLDKTDSFDEFREKFLKLPEGADVKAIGAVGSLVDRINAIKKDLNGQTADFDHLTQAGKAVVDELKVVRGQLQSEYDKAWSEYLPLKQQMESLSDRKKLLVNVRRNLMTPSEVGLTSLEQALKELEDVKSKIEILRMDADFISKKSAFDLATKNLSDVRTNAQMLHDTLSRIRPMGTSGIEKQVSAHLNNSRSPMRKIVEEAYSHYPTDWFRKSEARSTLTPKKVDRGYYSDWGREIAISQWGGSDQALSTAFHELGHRFEKSIPEILQSEKEFYSKRTAGESLEWLGSGYSHDEKTRKDDFIHPYMGKDYKGTAYELVSMGFQYAYSEPLTLAKDPEMEAWIYGMLALY